MASFEDKLQSGFMLCGPDGAIGFTCCVSDRHHTDLCVCLFLQSSAYCLEDNW